MTNHTFTVTPHRVTHTGWPHDESHIHSYSTQGHPHRVTPGRITHSQLLHTGSSQDESHIHSYSTQGHPHRVTSGRITHSQLLHTGSPTQGHLGTNHTFIVTPYQSKRKSPKHKQNWLTVLHRLQSIANKIKPKSPYLRVTYLQAILSGVFSVKAKHNQSMSKPIVVTHKIKMETCFCYTSGPRSMWR